MPAVALCGGVAVYLLGHIAFRLRNLGTVNKQRVAVALVAAAFIPLAVEIDALWTPGGDGGADLRPDRLRGDPLPRGARAHPQTVHA